MKKYIYIYIIAKIAQFTVQEKLPKKGSKLNVILSDLTAFCNR